MLLSKPLALYIHVPFCARKCPYCDFYSVVASADIPLFDSYSATIIKELKYYSHSSEWKDKRIDSIYFGGGTPSLLPPKHIEQILVSIEESYPINSDAEISIEVNPISAATGQTRNQFDDLRKLGFNRISIGVQSFAEQKLQFLGRLHNAEESRQAITFASSAGFSNISIDLIFGAPNETLLDWENDITTALRFNPQHISAYSLTIEPGSEFYKLQSSGNKVTASDDVMAGMYQCSQQILQESSFIHYEVSNYAKPSFECRHNISYWTYKDYLGLGSGAHSYIKTKDTEYGTRWSNIRDVKKYIRMIEENGTAKERSENLTKEEVRLEFFLLSLRQKVGISKSEYQQKFRENFDQRYHQIINKLVSESLIGNNENNLFLTEKGFLLADSIIAEFVDA